MLLILNGETVGLFSMLFLFQRNLFFILCDDAHENILKSAIANGPPSLNFLAFCFGDFSQGFGDGHFSQVEPQEPADLTIESGIREHIQNHFFDSLDFFNVVAFEPAAYGLFVGDARIDVRLIGVGELGLSFSDRA